MSARGAQKWYLNAASIRYDSKLLGRQCHWKFRCSPFNEINRQTRDYFHFDQALVYSVMFSIHDVLGKATDFSGFVGGSS